ncbi:hypothetical protein IEC33019_1674 [Pseudomonas putida]|uniref:Uncharacterized protein n=1 Tax=Pseudomonas putida TaxID=303 RepID=A0A1B2F4X0_PSEPU|nr:hypothetical protein IEC33019_1674 [Pseudomonas putida]
MGLGRLWRVYASARNELGRVVHFCTSQSFVGKFCKVEVSPFFVPPFTLKHRNEEQGVFR